MSEPSERGQEVDLGTITAHEVDPPRAAPPPPPPPPAPPPGGTGPTRPAGNLPVRAPAPVDRLRGAAAGAIGGAKDMARDIRDAHRGPKANSRPVPDWVSRLAWVLDESIPVGGGRRVGIEGMMSFVPGIGDAAGLAASMVVVLAGIGAGVSLPTMTLMMVNVGLDTIIGAVPFVGALFDLGYKSNTRNMALIQRDLGDRAATRRSAIRVLVLSVLAVFLWMLLMFIAFFGSLYLFVRMLDRLF